MLLPLRANALETAFALSNDLRKGGVAVPPVSSTRKMKNQLSAASDSGAKWAVLIGEDEMKSGKLTVKNLQTREQIQVEKADALRKLLS